MILGLKLGNLKKKLVGTAVPKDVRSGKTFVGTTGKLQTGTANMASFKKLWSRSNGTDFNAQTVSLDLSDYAAVAIVFWSYGSYAYSVKDTAFCAKGSSTTLYAYYNYDDCYFCHRDVSVSATGVTFATAKKRTSSANLNEGDHPAACFPVEIWGIPQGG